MLIFRSLPFPTRNSLIPPWGNSPQVGTPVLVRFFGEAVGRWTLTGIFSPPLRRPAFNTSPWVIQPSAPRLEAGLLSVTPKHRPSETGKAAIERPQRKILMNAEVSLPQFCQFRKYILEYPPLEDQRPVCIISRCVLLCVYLLCYSQTLLSAQCLYYSWHPCTQGPILAASVNGSAGEQVHLNGFGHVNGWFTAVYMSCLSQNFRFFSCNEFILSKLSNFSAHVSGVSVLFRSARRRPARLPSIRQCDRSPSAPNWPRKIETWCLTTSEVCRFCRLPCARRCRRQAGWSGGRPAGPVVGRLVRWQAGWSGGVPPPRTVMRRCRRRSRSWPIRQRHPGTACAPSPAAIWPDYRDLA